MANEKTDNMGLIKNELETVKGELARVRKELKASQDEYLQLEEDHRKVRSLLSAKAQAKLPPEAKGAVPVREPCAFVTPDGRIVNALIGDLVLVADDGEARVMQKTLGAGFRVHAVSDDTLRSLEAEGMLAQ